MIFSTEFTMIMMKDVRIYNCFDILKGITRIWPFLFICLFTIFHFDVVESYEVEKPDCPSGWVNDWNVCYLFNHNATVSYAEAMEACAEENSTLVNINDAREQDILTNRLRNESDRWHGYTIGLNDIAEEGSFVWSDRRRPVFTSWIAGEPVANGDDCVGMIPYDDGKWKNYPCDGNNAYICERHIDLCSEPIVVETGSQFQFLPSPIDVENIILEIRASNEVYIALSSSPKADSEEWYRIGFGGPGISDKTVSAIDIKSCKQSTCEDFHKSANSRDHLNANDFRPFVIDYNQTTGYIEVTDLSGSSLALDSTPFNVHYLGYAIGPAGGRGTLKICVSNVELPTEETITATSAEQDTTTTEGDGNGVPTIFVHGSQLVYIIALYLTQMILIFN